MTELRAAPGDVAMVVRMLGPLEIEVDGEPVSIGGPRIRRLFASLVLADGSVRSVDSLIDAVWAGEVAPDGARRTLMSYVSRLRSALEVANVEQIAHGYRLDGGGVSTDVADFERLVAEAQLSRRAGNHVHAAALYAEALRLWRGDPLVEFAGEPWAEPERARLLTLHLAALEGVFESRIELGEHHEVLAALEAAADAHPDDEHLQFLHMLALYRSGQQSQALARYQWVRRHLAELGLDPSPELRDLEYGILTHDEAVFELDPEVGSSVRGYRLEDRLGEGSLGTIYRAAQPQVGRDVAIKVIKPEYANDPQFVRRFETEAQLVARLEHPHVVPLYDYWREPGGAFLVMRLLRGGTAEQRLAADGALPVSTVSKIVEDVGGALAAAHARGVIHRDVKPGNILFDDDGQSYLADFGIAVEHGVRPAGREIASGLSSRYASPEQLRGDEASPRSDVYALGVTIYELLVGRPAFPAGSTPTPFDTASSDTVPSVVLDRRGLPHAVDAVLTRATAVEPADRFSSVASLVLAFRSAMTTAPGQAPGHESRLPVLPSPDETGETGTADTALVDVQLASFNPYKGLRAFEEADAQDFFGRDSLVDELVDRVDRRRLMAVVGASGSGKSSLVRAGLVPRLQDRGWFTVAMVPGSRPLEELQEALLRIATGELPGQIEQLAASSRGITQAVQRILPPDGSQLMLIVDQFEEVFTLAEAGERDAFLGALVGAVDDPRSRLRVSITVRADFFDRPLRHRQFGERLQDATLNVLPMSRAELTSAIEGPASRVGVRFEPGLVDEIVDDVGDGAGALPLLQYALTELYERRAGPELTSAGYREIGGVTGALAQRAEEVYGDLDAADRNGARRLFTRLVTPGEGVEDIRRPARRAELTVCSDTVIDAFGDYRLLSFDRDPATRSPTVEVAHEALIREWSRLRGWLDDDREGLRIVRHLTAAAAAWNDADRDPGELYRGGRLDAALEWSDGRETELATDEREFLDASRDLREAEAATREEQAAQRERQHRRLRRSFALLALVAVTALIATAVALRERSSARDQADAAALARAAAETRRLVSDAVQLAPTNRRVALLLAAEAHRRQPDATSLGALKDALVASTDVHGYVGADVAFHDVAWTSDGRVVGSHAGGVVVLSADGRRELEIDQAGADEVAVRADDRVVAVAGSDATVRIFDLDTGAQVVSPLDHRSVIEALAFSGDGSVLVTGDRHGVVRTFDSAFELVDEIDVFGGVDPLDVAADVPPPLAHDPISFVEGVIDVAAGSDGRIIAAVGGTELAIWRIDDSTEPKRIPVTRVQGIGERLTVPTGVGIVAVDGVQRVVATEVLSASIHDAATGDRVDRWQLTGGTTQIAVDPSVATADDMVVSTLDDDKLRVRRSDGSVLVVDSQLGSTTAVAVDSGGQRAVVAGANGALVVSLVGTGLISRSVPGLDRQEISVSGDGSTVVNSEVGGVGSRMWTLSSDRYVEAPLPDRPEAYALVGMPLGFTYDERDLTFQLADPTTMQATGALLGPTGGAGHDISPDGRLLALGGTLLTSPGELATHVWDVETGDLVALLDDFANDESTVVRSTRFSPDGERLLLATDDGMAVFYDTREWNRVEPVLSAGGGAVVQAAYSHDGRTLATVSTDGTITLRDPVTLQPDGRPLLGNTDAVEGYSLGPFFSEDDRWLVSAADGRLRLFDLDERSLVGEPFPRSGDITSHVSRNARFGVSAVDGVGIVWMIDPDRWPEIACQAAGRNLTPDEWRHYGPTGEPYRPSCDQWPSLAEQPEGETS